MKWLILDGIQRSCKLRGEILRNMQNRTVNTVFYDLTLKYFTVLLYIGLGLSAEYLNARGLTELHPSSTLASSEFPFGLDGK